jgi:surfactin synthase thioesterase subunit
MHARRRTPYADAYADPPPPPRTHTHTHTHTHTRRPYHQVGRQWGIIPSVAMNNAELLELMLPALRADLNLWEKYRVKSTDVGEPLKVPVLAFGGAAG